jgi:hypothetical protein
VPSLQQLGDQRMLWYSGGFCHQSEHIGMPAIYLVLCPSQFQSFFFVIWRREGSWTWCVDRG